MSDSRTPLLSRPSTGPVQYQSISRDLPTIETSGDPDGVDITKYTPLPKLQVAILCLMRLCEPIAFTVVFPMVAFMVADFDKSLSEKEIGFYSGAVESVFAFSQLLTVMPWGKLSDRIGRKPVLIIGLSGAVLSTVAFGFSKSFPHMIAARAIGGILNGNSAVVKSMMGEMTTSNNQALGFSFLPLSYAMGSTIGPLLGGYLSRPAERFPNTWFHRTPFWHENPWLLPCLIASITPLVACILGHIWLVETLRPKVGPMNGRHSDGTDGADGDSRTPILHPESDDEVSIQHGSPGILTLLQDRNLQIILINYSVLAFQAIALEALLVLFAYTPIRSGGIEFSAASIGVALSVSGVLTMAVQLILFSPLQKKYGTAKLYQICMLAYPVIFLLFPLIHVIAQWEQSHSNTGFIGVWIGLSVLLLLKTTANIVFSCNMLLVNSAAPTRDSLGTVNGIAQCCASFVRAIGPITASSMFAVSVLHDNIAQGNTVFYIFSCLALLAFLSSLRIREGGERWRNH